MARQRPEPIKPLGIARPEDMEAYQRAIGDVDEVGDVSIPPPVETASETRIPVGSVAGVRESSVKYAPPLEIKADIELRLETVIIGVLLFVLALGWAFLTWNWRGFAAGMVMGAIFTPAVFLASFLMSKGSLRNNSAFRALFYGFGVCSLLMTMVLSPTISRRAWHTPTNTDPSVVKFAWNPLGRVTSVALEHQIRFSLWATAMDGNPVQVIVDGERARLGMKGAQKVLSEQPLTDEFVKQELRIFASDLVADYVITRNLSDIPQTFAIRASDLEISERLGPLDVQWHGVLTVSRRDGK